jgi:hypothetical protein
MNCKLRRILVNLGVLKPNFDPRPEKPSLEPHLALAKRADEALATHERLAEERAETVGKQMETTLAALQTIRKVLQATRRGAEGRP